MVVVGIDEEEIFSSYLKMESTLFDLLEMGTDEKEQ